MSEPTDEPMSEPHQVRLPAPSSKSAVPDWYPGLLDAVANCVRTGRQRAITAANQELVATYWAVGSEILARQDAEGWGARVIDRLSADLRKRFPRTSGFSPRNLKYMRAFAAAWPDAEIVQRSVAQLPWRHNIALLDKLDDPDLRLWYTQASVEQAWSRNMLVHHIEGQFHQRAGKAVTNFARTLPPPESDLAQQSTRDPYLFDFVGNADIRRERDLELALTEHVEKFLLELGQGFAFVGRQVQLEIGVTTTSTPTAPIGVAEWKTAITESLPAELESSLPTIEELEAELADEPGNKEGQ